MSMLAPSFLFFFNDTATTEIYTLSLHDALPISFGIGNHAHDLPGRLDDLGKLLLLVPATIRSEEHTSELQSLRHLVCRLLLEKKKHLLMPTAECRDYARRITAAKEVVWLHCCAL